MLRTRKELSTTVLTWHHASDDDLVGLLRGLPTRTRRDLLGVPEPERCGGAVCPNVRSACPLRARSDGDQGVNHVAHGHATAALTCDRLGHAIRPRILHAGVLACSVGLALSRLVNDLLYLAPVDAEFSCYGPLALASLMPGPNSLLQSGADGANCASAGARGISGLSGLCSPSAW